MRQREDRITVCVEARMRSDAGWTDIVIRNVSPRGMLIKASPTPPSGAYVEIRSGNVAIVGCAVWAKHNMIGVRLQDRLQIDALFGIAARKRPAENPATRLTNRVLAGIAGRNRDRDRARQFQNVAFLLAFALAAAAIAHTVSETLAAPFAAVRDGMERR